jgi:sodium/bile acid cotransporter 7
LNLRKLVDKQNVFLLLLLVMVLAGKLIPYRESYNQIFNLEQFIDWGIAGGFRFRTSDQAGFCADR